MPKFVAVVYRSTPLWVYAIKTDPTRTCFSGFQKNSIKWKT